MKGRKKDHRKVALTHCPPIIAVDSFKNACLKHHITCLQYVCYQHFGICKHTRFLQPWAPAEIFVGGGGASTKSPLPIKPTTQGKSPPPFHKRKMSKKSGVAKKNPINRKKVAKRHLHVYIDTMNKEDVTKTINYCFPLLKGVVLNFCRNKILNFLFSERCRTSPDNFGTTPVC